MRIGVILITLLVVSGCGRADLHQGLTEESADEILVVLSQNDIEAAKEREVSGQDVSWKVTVKQGDLVKAREILVSHNLPLKQELGLSGVYKEKGLIPTPDEQKARFLLALKGEIVNSLKKIPGVVDADVVLNVPTESEFSDLDTQKKRPTASVIVKTKDDPEVAATVTEGKVQRFVANTVQNLDPNDVTVIVTRAAMHGPSSSAVAGVTPPPVPGEPGDTGVLEEGIPPRETEELRELAGIRLEPQSVGRFKAYMVSLLGLLVLVSSVLLVSIVRFNRLKVRLQRGEVVSSPALEGGTRGFLGAGGPGESGMEGTFDVGAKRQN